MSKPFRSFTCDRFAKVRCSAKGNGRKVISICVSPAHDRKCRRLPGTPTGPRPFWPIGADALESEIAEALAHVQLELPIFLPTGRRSGDRGRARTRRRSQGRVHGIWSSFGG